VSVRALTCTAPAAPSPLPPTCAAVANARSNIPYEQHVPKDTPLHVHVTECSSTWQQQECMTDVRRHGHAPHCTSTPCPSKVQTIPCPSSHAAQLTPGCQQPAPTTYSQALVVPVSDTGKGMKRAGPAWRFPKPYTQPTATTQDSFRIWCEPGLLCNVWAAAWCCRQLDVSYRTAPNRLRLGSQPSP
jgi:hypothetical protein